MFPNTVDMLERCESNDKSELSCGRLRGEGRAVTRNFLGVNAAAARAARKYYQGGREKG